MPRFDKWLTGVSADAPVDRVARKALKTRLRAVAWFLDRVQSDEAEDVHQLRIWTRRAGAALELFAATIPPRRRKWMKRTLRKIRRTAGRVRDLDVLLSRLNTEEASQRLGKVVTTLRRQRRGARRDLKSLRRKLLQHGRLVNKSDSLGKEIAWPKRHSSRTPPAFGFWCREQLAPLARAFFRLAGGNLSSDQRLHEFRLAGKRLRYALELAAGVLRPQPHRLFYVDLNLLQDRLGEVCDRLAAVQQYEVWLAEARKAGPRRRLRGLLETERSWLERSRRQFLRWWTAARREKLRRRWEVLGGGTRD